MTGRDLSEDIEAQWALRAEKWKEPVVSLCVLCYLTKGLRPTGFAATVNLLYTELCRHHLLRLREYERNIPRRLECPS